MEVTHKNIEEYIARFMEGETTNAEEQAIYRYFRTADVPEHLKPYASMFAWYEDGMPEEDLFKGPKPEVPVRMRKPLWKRIPLEMWSMGIAAPSCFRILEICFLACWGRCQARLFQRAVF